MIHLTESAKNQIQKMAETDNQSSMRLAVRGGGCAGMMYDMQWDEPTDKDKVAQITESIKLVIDPKSYLFLLGTTIDYQESLLNKGFVFENPNASGGCGCGTSFSV